MADFPMRKPPPGLFLPKSVRSVNCRLSDRERTHGRGDIKLVVLQLIVRLLLQLRVARPVSK